MINKINNGSSLNGAELPIGENLIEWTFLFKGKTYIQKSIKVIVKDNQPPVLICKEEIVLTLDKLQGDADIKVSDIVIKSDDCSPFDLILNGKTLFDCRDVGITPHKVWLEAIDMYGNSSSCTTTITVQYDPLLDPKAEFEETEICNDSIVRLNLTNHQDFRTTTNWKWTVDVSSGITPDNELDDETTTNGDYTITQSFFNSTNTFDNVTYHVVPMMYMQKCELETISVSVIVNPHPKLLDIKDTSICNNTSFVLLTFSRTKVSNNASIYYDWTAQWDNGSEDGGRNELDTPVEKELQNNSIEFQNVTYTLTPTLYLNEKYCETPNAIKSTITVEPTPLIKVSVQDTVICNYDTVQFAIDSLIRPFGKWQYWLEADSPFDDFATPEYEQTGSESFLQTFQNNTTNYQSMKYKFSPHIITKQGHICEASKNDTTVFIHVNPTPLMEVMYDRDSICHKDNGPKMLITSENGNVLGDLKYNLWKVEYTNYPNDDVVANAATPDILTFTNPTILDQAELWNKSEEEQTVVYYFYPLIEHRNHKCYGDSLDPKKIHLAPELKYDTIVPIYNGYQITCKDLSNGSIYVDNVSGGWFDKGYSYQWKKNINENQWEIITDSVNSSISGLPDGTFEVTVSDYLKCETKKTIRLREPERLTITIDSLKSPSCHGPTGSIYASSSGGVGQYKYSWYAKDLFNYQDVEYSYLERLNTGVYNVSVIDANQCKDSIPEIKIDYLGNHNISVTWWQDEYGPDINGVRFNVSCNGAKDGRINPNPGKIASEYKLKLNGEIVAKDSVQKGEPWIQFNTLRDFRISNLVAGGNYELTVIDTIGCEFVSSIPLILTEPKPITFDSLITKYPNDYQIQCYGEVDGQIEIKNVKGGYGGDYDYRWTVLEGDPDIIVPGATLQDLLSAGTYQLIISNPYRFFNDGAWETRFCTDTSTYVLKQPPKLNVTANIKDYNGYHIKCFDDNSGSISLSVSGGGKGAYSYSWDTEDGSGLIQKDSVQNGLSLGVYIVEIGYSDGLCSHTEEYQLFRSPEPLRNDSIITHIKCYGSNDASVQINITGGAPTYTYLWSTLSDISIENPEEKDQLDLAPGVYELLVKDINGCEKKELYELTEPDQLILTLLAEDMSCNPGNDGTIELIVAGGTPEYFYSWNNGHKTRDLFSLQEGTYTVTVTDANHCTETSSANIKIPPLLKVKAEADTPYNGYHIDCYGNNTGKISLTIENGRGGYTYQWSSGDVTEGINNATADSYSVIVTDRFNCTGSAETTLIQPSMMWGQFAVTDVTCFGGDNGSLQALVGGGVITKDMPYRYQWSNGVEDVSRIDQLTEGTYNVKVIDNNGCHFDTQMIITQPPNFEIKFITTNAFCLETSDGEIMATISGATPPYIKYEWKSVNGMLPTSAIQGKSERSAGIIGLPTGVYSLDVTDFANCTISKEVILDFSNEGCLRIPNAFSPNDDGVNDTWEITVGDARSSIRYPLNQMYPEAIVEVWSTNWGLLLFRSQKGYPDSWDGKYNGKFLPVNSYQYRIRLNNTIKPITGNVHIIR